MSDYQPRSVKFVCGKCLEDDGLRRFAEENRRPGICAYCTTSGVTTDVVALDDVIREMRRYISRQWFRPTEDEDALPANIDDFLTKWRDSIWLFKEIEFSVSNAKLMADFEQAFESDQWCRKRLPMTSPSTKWADSWQDFKDCVMYHRRYTFWGADIGQKQKPGRPRADASGILYEIRTLLNKSHLVRAVNPGTLVWRAAVLSENETPKVPERFTSPPPKLATQPSRMSPAGIPMFYGADEFETACRELVNPYSAWLEGKGKVSMAVQFRTVRRLNILDLTVIPARRSFFMSAEGNDQFMMDFLREFAEDLSIPIKKDHRLHIDYVPTQVFTEFVRFMMKGPKGVPINGIRYSSSRTGRPCWVIFANHIECLRQPEKQLAGRRMKKRQQLLDYVEGSARKVRLPWTKTAIEPPESVVHDGRPSTTSEVVKNSQPLP